MPLYDYRCSACGKVTEIRHGFNETNAQTCPHCGGALTRVFNPAPIIFSGSGFYVTDSRGSSESAAPSTSSESSPAGKSDSAA